VNFTIGKSDFHKDWFFEQVPHNENSGNITGSGRAQHDVDDQFQSARRAARQGDVAAGPLRHRRRSIAATVNEESIGNVTGLTYNATINRDGIGGAWCERDLIFDAAQMKAGENILKLTIRRG